MFNKLTDFGYKRTTNQAIGFYIAYLVVMILVAMIASILFGGADASFDVGVKIGTNVAVIGSLALSFAVLQKRNLLGDFKYILLGLLAGVLAFLGGGLFGLIPVAYMTTK